MYRTNEVITRYFTNDYDGVITTYPGSTNASTYSIASFPSLPGGTYPQGDLATTFYPFPNANLAPGAYFNSLKYTTALDFYSGDWTDDIPAALFQFPVTATDGDTGVSIPDGEITLMADNPDPDDHAVWNAIAKTAGAPATPTVVAQTGMPSRNFIFTLSVLKNSMSVSPNFGPGTMSPRDPDNIAWLGTGITAVVYDLIAFLGNPGSIIANSTWSGR